MKYPDTKTEYISLWFCIIKIGSVFSRKTDFGLTIPSPSCQTRRRFDFCHLWLSLTRQAAVNTSMLDISSLWRPHCFCSKCASQIKISTLLAIVEKSLTSIISHGRGAVDWLFCITFATIGQHFFSNQTDVVVTPRPHAASALSKCNICFQICDLFEFIEDWWL